MATKTKIEKERQRLIEKYGDKILIEIVDYYYPEIITNFVTKISDLWTL